jgi:uncharacterized protein YggU (UPF0235/DUF167 family)
MYIKVKVIPDSKHEKVEQLKDDEYRIWVKEPAEHNSANTKVLSLIRDMFPGVSVRIISGHHSPSKILSIN